MICPGRRHADRMRTIAALLLGGMLALGGEVGQAQQGGDMGGAQAGPETGPENGPGMALLRHQVTKDSYVGRIEALTQADVSTVVDSIITEILFEPGQTVTAGDPLFILDSTDFELKLQTAQANVHRSAALLDSAQQDLRRAQLLKQRGSISDVRLLKATGALALAEAVHEQTLAELEEARTNLARTVVRAPITGVIGLPEARIGTYAQSGNKKRLARIVQLDPVRLSYQFPYVTRLRQMRINDLSLPESLLRVIDLKIVVGGAWVYDQTATPTYVSPDVDPVTGMITIWARVPNPDQLLRPGMQVSVVVTTDADAPHLVLRNN